MRRQWRVEVELKEEIIRRMGERIEARERENKEIRAIIRTPFLC